MTPEELGTKYDKIAAWWHREHLDSDYGLHQLERAMAMLRREQGNLGGLKALDVGCGAGGRMVNLLRSQGLEVTGVDVSAEMIALARASHPDCVFHHQDIRTWKTEQGYHLILAWDSIFHLPLESHGPVIEKLCSLLLPGGILIYTFGDGWGEHLDTWKDDQFYYSTIGINGNLSVLMNCGLTVTRLDLDQFPQPHVCVMASRSAQRANDPYRHGKALGDADTAVGTRPGMVVRQPFPILEFDPFCPAMIEPGMVLHRKDNIPRCLVLSFFQDVIDGLRDRGDLEVIMKLKSEMGPNPIYRILPEAVRRMTGLAEDAEVPEMALFNPGVGAPLAAGFLEELIALGGERFIACGGAGILDSDHHIGKVLVPVEALRDEGTSYHYLEPGRKAKPGARALKTVLETLEDSGVAWERVKTWTTDAIYRETPAKVEMRRRQGCGAVEMEAAAMFAVAAFRGVEFAQMIYAGDDLSGDFWDSRNWHRREDIRIGLIELAMKACAKV